MLGHLVYTHHSDDVLYTDQEPRWFTRLMRMIFGH